MDEKETKMNIDFYIPPFILLAIIRSGKRPNQKSLNDIIKVWYERESNTINSSETSDDVILNFNLKTLANIQNYLIIFATKYPDLLQNEFVLNEFINSYTDNFIKSKLKFESFTYTKNLEILKVIVKEQEKKGVSLSCIIISSINLKENITKSCNKLKIKNEKYETQFIIFLLMLARQRLIEIYEFNTIAPDENDSSKDYWEFKFSINLNFRKISALDTDIQSDNEKKENYVLINKENKNIESTVSKSAQTHQNIFNKNEKIFESKNCNYKIKTNVKTAETHVNNKKICYGFQNSETKDYKVFILILEQSSRNNKCTNYDILKKMYKVSELKKMDNSQKASAIDGVVKRLRKKLGLNNSQLKRENSTIYFA